MSNCKTLVKPKRFYALKGFNNHISKTKSLLRKFKRHDDVSHIKYAYELVNLIYERNGESKLPLILKNFITDTITLLGSSHSNNVKMSKSMLKERFMEYFDAAGMRINDHEDQQHAREDICADDHLMPSESRICVTLFEADPCDGSKYDLLQFSVLHGVDFRKPKAWHGKTTRLSGEMLYPGSKFSEELDSFVRDANPALYFVNTDSLFTRDYIKLDANYHGSFYDLKQKNFSNNGNVTPIIFDLQGRTSIENANPLYIFQHRFVSAPQLTPKSLTTFITKELHLIRDGEGYLFSNSYIHLLYIAIIFLDFLKNDYSPKYAGYGFIQRLFAI